jgi:hypothetical protein
MLSINPYLNFMGNTEHLCRPFKVKNTLKRLNMAMIG